MSKKNNINNSRSKAEESSVLSSRDTRNMMGSSNVTREVGTLQESSSGDDEEDNIERESLRESR